ncbi:MAG: ornithine carbamoyltransferase [Dehalococcoidales bacterium]|nr:ornithine carbamoyltransferase [Dehalococcoidales bacterium]
MKGKDLLSAADLSREDIQLLLSDTEELKSRGCSSFLSGKVLALLFEKPSLRTRVSLEVAMYQLGGKAIYLSPAEVGLGKRESVKDVACVLSRFADIIAARTFSHKTIEELAEYSTVPVINVLSDFEHPCQALADVFTIYEKKGEFKDLTIAYIGDGNNVANSLMLISAMCGINFRIASPKGYKVEESILHLAQTYAAESRVEVLCCDDPQTAVKGADAVYTDTWVSMGQEEESEIKRKAFKDYQVNSELMSLAKKDAVFMHCLPAHRGEEVTDEVMDSAASVVYDQAENRMHVAKAILLYMLGGLEVQLGYR